MVKLGRIGTQRVKSKRRNKKSKGKIAKKEGKANAKKKQKIAKQQRGKKKPNGV
jgi:hypothetical protein